MAGRRSTSRYPAALRARGVRLVRENRAHYASDDEAYRLIAAKLGCSRDALRAWCIQAERNAVKARIKELEREQRKLRTENEILKKATAYFARADFDSQLRK